MDGIQIIIALITAVLYIITFFRIGSILKEMRDTNLKLAKLEYQKEQITLHLQRMLDQIFILNEQVKVSLQFNVDMYKQAGKTQEKRWD